MLLGVRHLICKDTLQRRQTPASFLQFDEPSLTVGHTGDAVGDADLRNAAELIGKTARRPHTFTEIPLYLFLSHDEGLLQNFLHFKACIKFCCLYAGRSNSKGQFSMLWFKRLPNVALTQKMVGIYDPFENVFLVRAFRRKGKLWCIWGQEYLLLKSDGTCVGVAGSHMTWEAI